MGLLDRLSALLGGGDGSDAGEPFEPDEEEVGDGPEEAVDTDGESVDAADMTAGDFRQEAEEFAERHDDEPFDFSVDSLAALDDYAAGQGEILGVLGEEMDGAEGGAFLDQLQGGYMLWLGSYLGEVLVRNFDGTWREDDGWAVAVPVDGGAMEVAVFDLAARSVADEPLFAATAEEVKAARDGEVPLEEVAEGDGVEGTVAGTGADGATGPGAAARDLAAEWSAYDLDFTPASLARLDALVDDQWDEERFREAELGGGGRDDRVFTVLVEQLGSYYGEVLVRHLDGEWIEHEQLGTAVAVEGEDEAAAVSNAYHIAADCLTEPSKFALSFDTVVDQVDLDRERVTEGGHVVTADAEEWDDGADLDDGTLTPDDGAGNDGDSASDDHAESEPDELDPEEIAAGFREDAADLVETFPGYDLDYSPASLARLDRLVAEEFAGHDFSGVELGREDDGDSLFLTARAMEGGGYLAEVLARHLGGGWRDDGGLYFAVEGADAEARLDPVAIAADVFRGADSFAATYDALTGQLDVAAGGGQTGETEAGGSQPGAAEADRNQGAAEADRNQGAAAPEPPRDAAAAFAEEYPAYDLDFTPGSIARVDALAADLPGAPEAVREGMAAYVGETLVRRYGAAWTRDDGEWAVEIAGDAGEPVVVALGALVADTVAGDAAVEDVHDRLVDRLGLDADEAAGREPGPDEPEGGADGDEVIDRFAARAAAEAAAEDAREPAPEEVVRRHREAAEELVAAWPAHELDFSVESLVRLDALVAAEFDRSGGDRDYEGDPLSVPEGAQLSIPTDGSVAAFGGYLAELFRRHHDAAWRADGDDLVLRVEGSAGAMAFDPELVAVACFAGESSFVDAYAHVAAEAGLEPPISG